MVERLILLEHPNVCPGVYDLDLYCKYDNPDHRFDEFPHGIVECQTRRSAEALARKRGWLLHGDGTATCPKCARALKGST